MDPRLLAVARAAVGFMPDDEGLALHDAGVAGGRLGPLLEIGTYCGKSAVYLGAAAREAGTILYTVDHHRGSAENQAGWEHHDDRLVDVRTGRMDTLPFFRQTIEEAGLEDAVVAVVGSSPVVAAHWATPLGLVFVDGGHALEVALADYDGWARFVVPDGLLVFHDVFEDPADGGQAPFEVWQRAVASGDFAPRSTTGSLRVLFAHVSRIAVRSPGVLTYRPDVEERAEIWREAVTMVLYVSVVEIAELAALPEEHFAHGRVTGAVGMTLLEIVWGTAVGLAIAHWFAFRLAAPAFRGQAPTVHDTWIGLAQVGGAIFVAAVSSIPILFLSDVRAQELTGDVPALIIGGVSYALARRAGKSQLTAVFYGLTALALGVLVAAIKGVLAAH